LKQTLFTIGYMGFTPDIFIHTLNASGVMCLIDTRELAISRKRGFSKNALRENLESSGIKYRHFSALGSPKLHRHAVRRSGDYATFFSQVREHLSTEPALLQLDQVAEIAVATPTCLMCCCEDWQFCHRRCIVEAFASKGAFEISHIINPLRTLTAKPERAA